MKYTDNARAQAPWINPLHNSLGVLPLVYILRCSAVSTGRFIQRKGGGGNQKLRWRQALWDSGLSLEGLQGINNTKKW
jgi:hypothetical protein